MRSRALASALCLMIAGLGAGGTDAHAAQDDFAGRAWIGLVEVNGTDWHVLFDFRPDGSFVVRSRIESEDHGNWRRTPDGVAMQTAGGNVVYQAAIVDGRLVGTMRTSDGAQGTDFDLEPDAACAGERAVCRGRSFCIDPSGRQSLNPIPPLADGHAQREDSFSEFYDAFACAADLGLIETYADRIRFPLDVEDITFERAPDARSITRQSERQSIGRDGFHQRMIVVGGREEQPEQSIDPAFVPRDGNEPSRRVMRFRTHRLEAWTFRVDAHDQHWELTAVESCSPYDDVRICVNQLLCTSQPTAYPPLPPDGREDFLDFYRTFFCRWAPSLVEARTRFPLPYTYGETEGTLLPRDDPGADFLTMTMFDSNIVFNSESPMTSVSGDTASAFLPSPGRGQPSIDQQFSRIDGLWYLTRVEFRDY